MEKYIGALDLGTTSNRFIIFDRQGRIVALDQKEHEQIFPRPGWVEHDPMEIWNNAGDVIRGALAKAGVGGDRIAAVGITNQRETTLIWDKTTGGPFGNAVVWQCTRTDSLCRRLAADGGQDRFRDKTGLPIATYFSGPKASWILENNESARQAAQAGNALFGTVETWIIWWLTGGPDGGAHVTDVSNASRTLLMNLHTLDWDAEILEILKLPAAMLPRIVPSIDSQTWGTTRPDGPLGAAVPVCGALGDQQAALVGQTCFDIGEAKNTYGTGCFLLLNTGTQAVASKHGLVTTVGYQVRGEAPVYCLEGSVAIAGALVQWLRDNIGIIKSAPEIEALAASVEDNGGALNHLKVDGGMVANNLLMQFQADLLDVPVIRPKVTETTALGAAYAAGLACGFWSGLDDLRRNWAMDKTWQPDMDAEARRMGIAGWRKAVERTFGWVEE